MAKKNSFVTLYEIALKFLVPLGSHETHKLIVKEAISLVKATDGTLFIKDQDFIIRAYSTVPAEEQPQPRKNGNIINVYKKQKTLIISRKRLKREHPEVNLKQTQSILILPIVDRNKSIGVLALRAKKEKFFTKEKVESVTLFSTIVSLAIRKTQLYDQINKALESRDYFISLASHELKTPLSTVLLYSNIIEKAVKRHKLPSEKWVKSLTTEATRMSHLFNELLEIEKIKTGQLTFTWKTRHLLDIVQAARTRFTFVHPTRKVVVTTETDRKHDIIICDPEKLLQVFTNILNNAGKFSKEASTIEIIVRHSARYIRVSIADKGKGISDTDLPKIFDKFYKGKNHTVQGMGLGLFLGKHIMDTHHGKIAITSEVDKGTIVNLTFPRID